jgi:AraC-like DNA-binding protein
MKTAAAIIRFFHSKRLYLLPPVLAAGWFLAAIPHRDSTIFPGMNPSDIIAFDDYNSKGTSSLVDFEKSDSGITIRYILRDGLLYPFAGFKLLFGEGRGTRDFSSFDNVKMELSFRKQQTVDFYLHTILPGFTQPDKIISYRFLYKYFVFLHPRETCTVDLKSLETPCWWYYQNNLPDKSLGRERFNKVTEIVIQSGSNNPINETFEFTLKKLSIHRNIGKRAVAAGCFAGGWLIFYFLLVLLVGRSRPLTKNVVVSYEPLSVGNDQDDCAQRVFGIIAKEYSNPDLSVHQVSWNAGVGPEKVSQVIRDKTNYSYKQYLNAIRLAEAKRLLLETDRNIVDISRKVGYGNVTHFNRIFKKIEGVSPREFRNAHASECIDTDREASLPS